MASRTWAETQALGGAGAAEGDISAVEFSEEGDFIAVGDKSGRVKLYGAHETDVGVRYASCHEFQSHVPEFDSLKSLEIEEKINMIRFCHRRSSSVPILTTNDKTIKLWKIRDHFSEEVESFHSQGGDKSKEPLHFPTVKKGDIVTSESCEYAYMNAHTYHINSISLNSDQETFLSADDLRINIWNYEVSHQSYNIVDNKPENMEELSEVITAAQFHPISCNLLMYSSSRGSLRLVDLREGTRCNDSCLLFDVEEDPAEKAFYTEIVSSISDIAFVPNGELVLSRDYLSLKVWDLRNAARPIETFPIHEHLKPLMGDLYESDCIFDRFECSSNHTGRSYATGSYGDHFMVYDLDTGKGEALFFGDENHGVGAGLDFSKKVLHTCFHPLEDCVAVSSLNMLYLFRK